MKTTVDISPEKGYTFNAGQVGRYLIIREASQSIILKGDALRPIELERGDVVDVSQFDELTLYNNHSTSIHIEYQVADVEVRIRTSATSIDGALIIDEVQSPITIDRIQEPLDINVSIPDVNVNIPDVKAVLPSNIEIGNFPEEQAVRVVNQPAAKRQEVRKHSSIIINGEHTINANHDREGLIIIASKENTGTVTIAGFIPLEAGGHTTLPATNEISITGITGDSVYIGEVVNAI